MITNRKNKLVISVLILIVSLHLIILRKLVFFPYPEQFIYPYLTQQGLLPYKDILDQHFPGLLFFPINLNNLGMTTPVVARIWQFGLIILTHTVLYFVARKVFKSDRWAIVANVLFFVWQPFFEGYALWIDSFVSLVLLGSFYVFLDWLSKSKSIHLFWTGFLLGIALLFKQAALPLILIIGMLAFFEIKSFQRMKPYLLGLSIPIFFLLFYIFSIGVIKDFIFWTVTYNLTTFSQMGRKYPNLGGFVKSIPLFGLAFFAWIYLYLKKRGKKLYYLGMFLVGSLFFAYARFDFIHLQPALPFAVLITVFFIKKTKIKLLIPFFVVYTAALIYLLLPFYRVNLVDKVLFFGEFERKIIDSVNNKTNPGDTIFAMGTTLHIYQMTNTLPPGNVFVFQFPWFMVEAEERILAGIIDDPPKVVVRDKKATTGGQNLISYMQNIDKHVEKNYKTIEMIDGVEIMIQR